MLPRNPSLARPYGAPVKQVGFRARLFLILLGFALIPTIVLAAAWEMTVVRALPLLGTTPAMERHRGDGRARDRRRRGRRRSRAEQRRCWTSISARSTKGCCAASRWSS